jgi:type III pantothenate kinase
MQPSVVVDVGNTRLKWGRCAADGIVALAALAHDDEAGWENQWRTWGLTERDVLVLSGVAPARRERFAAWLRQHGITPRVLDHYTQLPVAVLVDEPDRVGLDRLLNAVAANSVRQPEHGAILVDAGTAVTVDYVDAAGAFLGGAIFPGLRLMAKALHEYTALLPLVDVDSAVAAPGKNTVEAIQAGVLQAVVGGIEALARHMSEQVAPRCEVFCTGGDASLIASKLAIEPRVWPEMTLEGIRLSALSPPTPSPASGGRKPPV